MSWDSSASTFPSFAAAAACDVDAAAGVGARNENKAVSSSLENITFFRPCLSESKS